jgi:hypothetical protein
MADGHGVLSGTPPSRSSIQYRNGDRHRHRDGLISRNASFQRTFNEYGATDMKSTRSVETVRLRRDLALLLKQLRALRREKLSLREQRQRLVGAIAQAGSLGEFVTITDPDEKHVGLSVVKAKVQALEDEAADLQFEALAAVPTGADRLASSGQESEGTRG